jgi:hypothetical protein
MSDLFHVRITFTDGSEEFLRDATHARVADGVLYVERRWYGQLGHQEEDLGAYPLANIKTYRREER